MIKNLIGGKSLILTAAWLCASLIGVGAPAEMPDALLTTANPRVQEVIRIQESVTAGLMGIDGILGSAVGDDDAGGIALIIYIDTENANRGQIIKALPADIKGARVKAVETDKFRAFGKPAAGAKPTPISHTAKQTPPILLGTSGGWGDDLANGYCCGGTLGSLVQIGTTQYILSNYHVFEADIVAGGNNRVATAGDSILQPGLIDVACNKDNAQSVATLSGIKSLPGSNVDAALAQVVDGKVRPDGAILEIGTIASTTIPPKIGQLVKKSGRTTGLTRSKVSGLNATVSVSYENECAGGTAFTKTYTGQIVISNKGSSFLAGGDSGSLMVEDVATKPHAVGLLFAGSSVSAIANPINEVLSYFGATMVGN